jgi:hypothetical protein
VRVRASFREPGADTGEHRGVHRPLQPRVAHRAVRASDAGAGPSRRAAKGRMTADRSQATSRTWLRNCDLGAALTQVSPETGRVTVLTRVQRTGCGTHRDTRV